MKMFPVRQIPRRGGARAAEIAARAAGVPAAFEIVDAAGCGDDTHGAVCTRAAAAALEDVRATSGGCSWAVFGAERL